MSADPTAPDGLEQAIEQLDQEACDLLKRYYALGLSAFIFHLSDSGHYRILTPERGSALVALVIDEIPALLQSATTMANDLAKAGRKH